MWDAIIIRPFINLLLIIYNLVGSFGWAIVLFTILIRLVIYPLMAKQINSSKKMAEMQQDKRYLEMQKKYKNDQEKLAQEQMKLYKELGVSPFASCLPTLIQFPIIIGLYQAIIQSLANSPIELMNLMRHIYPNLLNMADLIPLQSKFLWMDLGQPERLFIPGISFGIPILAIIVVTTTYLQSKMTMANSAAGNEQAKAMSNMMNLYMPILMGYLALSLASGLAVYFVISNLMGIVQYALMGQLDFKKLLPSREPADNSKKSK